MYPLEAGARRRYGEALRRTERPGCLAYELKVQVLGRPNLVPVRVEFYRDPPYARYRLSAADYPRVFADPGACSPHRMPDDSLCLYYPDDPPSRRWTADDGLDELFALAARHLFAEDYWRSSNHTWPFDEAPHGRLGVAP
ncbi:hypothetical protein [Microbacterium sp. NPDC089696]|uniref:hypothetical protein n=1 Tax=Microbacterium sp. NPDC089696 TaxID=3364199 RepID=UPI0038040BE5